MKKYTGDIEKDLSHFALYVMADCVVNDKVMADYLANKAKVIYKHNENWGRKLLRGNAKERDLLIAFMEHWFDAFVAAPEHIVAKEKLDKYLLDHWKLHGKDILTVAGKNAIRDKAALQLLWQEKKKQTGGICQKLS